MHEQELWREEEEEEEQKSGARVLTVPLSSKSLSELNRLKTKTQGYPTARQLIPHLSGHRLGPF